MQTVVLWQMKAFVVPRLMHLEPAVVAAQAHSGQPHT